MKRTVLITLLLLALAGGYWAWRSHQKQQENALVLYGNIDIREVNLAFRVSGRIKEVLKDEGDTVKVGELAASLDAEPYRHEMQEAEAQAASLRAKVQMLQAGYRKEDIQQAAANVTEGEAVLANAQRTLLRKQDLVAKKVGPQQEYDDAIGARDEAQARLNSYRAALAMQQAGYRPEEIAQAQADLAKAEASLAAAQLHVTDTELRAPANGIVMTRALEPGAIVETGSTILSVSLTDPVWARAYVAEDHLGQVHPGTKVLVYTDTRPNKPYNGQIGYISPEAEFTPKSVETPELRPSLVYRIRIVISDPDQDLRQGMPVTARLPENTR